MQSEANLSGQRVLVVEDDYYLASETAEALRGVGAEVLGPCPTEEAAQEMMERAAPTAALVDINLGTGPSFKLARDLRRRGVPFVFVSGYDDEVIPAEFAGTPLLQKPIELRQLVGSLAEAFGKARPA
jgi:DNA-binding response OmpR family regulator